MFTSKLKKIGGSHMFAVPPAILQTMGFESDAEVKLSIDGDRLVIEKLRKPLRLEDLLAKCNPDAPLTEEDLEWVNAKPVGGELL